MKKLIYLLFLILMCSVLYPAEAPFSELPVTAEAASYSKSDPYLYTMVKGGGTTFSIPGAKSKITWSSNKKSVATVDQKGHVKAKKAGRAVVTAKFSGHTYYFSITIEDPKINHKSLTLEVGTSKTLSIKGTKAKINWKVTDKKIISINSKGTVKALKPGYASAYAFVRGVIFQCQVTSQEPSLVKAVQTGNTKYLSQTNAKIVLKARKVIKDKIKSSMSDVEKVKAIHDFLVLNTAYDYENYKNNTIPDSSYSPEGILLYKKGVCQAYAETFKLFMDVLKIPCRLISGQANGGGHAWNIVQLNKKWYQIDVTWDDPVPDQPGRVRYDYFLIPDSMMQKNHSWNKKSYPACTSSDYLYYTSQNYIVDSVSKFQDKFLEQFLKGTKEITVMYPENTYPDWNFIWNYTTDWSYYPLTQRGRYYVLTIIINS